MKKFIFVIVTMSMAAALVGCGDKEDKKPIEVEETTEVIESIDKTETPEADTNDDESSIDWQGLKDAYEEDFLNGEEPEHRQEGAIYIKDYVTVTFNGYEGGNYNKAEISVDWDEFAEDVAVPGIDSVFLEQCFSVREEDLQSCKNNGLEFEISVGDRTIYNTDFTQMYADEIAKLKENSTIIAEDFIVIVEGLPVMSYVKSVESVDITNIMSLIEAEAETFMDIQNEPMIGDLSFQLLFNWYDFEDCSVNSYEMVDSYFALKKMSSYSDSEAKELPNNMLCNIYKVNITRDSTGEILDVYVSISANDLFDESGTAIFEKTNAELELHSGTTAEAVMTDTTHMDITKLN